MVNGQSNLSIKTTQSPMGELKIGLCSQVVFIWRVSFRDSLKHLCQFDKNMSHLMTKQTKWSVRPVKTQISLGIRPVWYELLLCAHWVAQDPIFLHADSEGSDQTGDAEADLNLRWRICHFVGFVMRWLNYGFQTYKLIAYLHFI